VTRFYTKKAAGNLRASTLDVSATSVPHPGEHLCGDAWGTILDAHRAAFVIADGLGHGDYAEQAAQEAIRIFNQYSGGKPAELLEKMHSALRSTRGAAVAVAQIDLRQRQVSFAGVGNIAAEIIDNGNSRNLVSLNGIVGHEMRKVQEFMYPWSEGAILIMHSDGLGTKWNLDSYAGLSQRAPGVIAGVLYRDFSRRRDDVTVLVARQGKGQWT
jgi:serine phosphatase RsbU (regulator of sigma subunit)